MVENEQYQILSLLKKAFPDFKKRLEQEYWQDPVFRQIAREYHECIRKQNVEMGKEGRTKDIYAATIGELKDELLEHLKSNTS